MHVIIKNQNQVTEKDTAMDEIVKNLKDKSNILKNSNIE